MTASEDSPNRVRALLRRLWAAVLRYRGMVALMLLSGFLEAFFTKLPFALIQPLLAALRKEPVRPPADPNDWLKQLQHGFEVGFVRFANDCCTALGLQFAAKGMQVVVVCAGIAVICGLLGAVTIYFVQTISRLFAVRIVADLRGELAAHFLALPLRFYGKQRMAR